MEEDSEDGPWMAVVAAGQGGDGTGWEGRAWSALVSRAYQATGYDGAGGGAERDGAQVLDVDWDGLRAAGIVTEGRDYTGRP